VTVSPSVSPSHAGMETKLITIGFCGFHHRIAHRQVFGDKMSYPRSKGNPFARSSNENTIGKMAKQQIFDQQVVCTELQWKTYELLIGTDFDDFK